MSAEDPARNLSAEAAETSAILEENSVAPRKRWGLWCLVLLVIVAIPVGAWALLRSGPLRKKAKVAPVATLPPPAEPEVLSSDQGSRDGLAGTWERTSEYGVYTLTLQPDGTGEMFIEFSSFYKYVVAESLTMQMRWQVNKGRVVFDSISGEPEGAFNIVANTKGTKRDQLIREVSDSQAVFIDDKVDDEVQTWRKVSVEKSASRSDKK